MSEGQFHRYQVPLGFRFRWSGCPQDYYPEIFFLVYLLALFSGVLLQLGLFLRKTPFGVPYVLDLWNYLPHALFYSCYGISLVTLPFLIVAAIARRSVRRWCAWLYMLVLATTLIVTHIDNESLRFLGTHLSIDYLLTYAKPRGIPLSIYQAIGDDAGGPYGAVLLLFVPALFVCNSLIVIRKARIQTSKKNLFVFIVAVGMLFVFLPFLFRTSFFGSKNRQRKVASVVIVLAEDLREFFRTKIEYPEIEKKILNVRESWTAINTRPGWRFTSTSDPFARSMEGPCPAFGDTPWNFVIVSIETFRAINMHLLNPSEIIEATPYIYSLARSEHSSYFTRFIANGQPTIVSFMAVHTGLLPHSRKTVARAFPHIKLESYASLLRKHGYHAAFFGGSDPDWDNQRHWLTQWYDFVHYDKADQEEDRRVMRRAAKYLKDIAGQGTPIVLTAFLISNHLPFDSPEPVFNVYHGTDPRRKIANTLRYDDDVIREFFELIREETWFANTVFILTGDHGMDLGENGKIVGWENTRHETTWIPLVIHSKHPLNTMGRSDVPASHIDLAPTILHMAGICQENRFMGHSIFGSTSERKAINSKLANLGLESADFSIAISKNGEALLYHAKDMLQRQDVATDFPGVVNELTSLAKDASMVADYYYEIMMHIQP